MNLRASFELTKDTLRETLSSKVFYVLLACSTLLAIFVSLFNFEDVGEGDFGLQSVKIWFVGMELFTIPGEVKSTQAGFLSLIANQLCGRFGVLAAIIITGSFVPRMFQTGTIELYLSRPVRRWEIMLAKYFAGLSFVFLQSCWLVGLLFIAFGIRSGMWSVDFLWAIPILTFLFAVIYSFSVLMAVMWKTTAPTIFLTIAFWLLCGSLGIARGMVKGFISAGERMAQINGTTEKEESTLLQNIDRSLAVANYILPPTTELDTVASALYSGKGTIEVAKVKESAINPENRPSSGFRPPMADMEIVDVKVAMKRPIFTCLGFIIFCLGLASFLFYRKEF